MCLTLRSFSFEFIPVLSCKFLSKIRPMSQLREHFTVAVIIKVGTASLIVTSIGAVKVTPFVTGACLAGRLRRLCFELRFGLGLFFLFALKKIALGVKKGLDQLE